MKIKISQNLLELAELFQKHGKLFIVGGYIRNSFLGFTETDIDLASSLPPEKIVSLLKNTKFEIIEKIMKNGYIKIKCGDEVYEHTTFRKDNYYESGMHQVESVEYLTDIRQDAMRRDFTCNAIYYDIISQKIIDIYSGILDIKNARIRTVEVPGFVLAHDGVRILRMIKLASQLNFKIDFATFATAKKYTKLLADISGARKFDELMAILQAPKRYSISKKNAHIKGLSYFNDLHLWNSFYIPISRVRLKMVKNVSAENVFFGFLIDVIDSVKPDCIEYFLKDLLGANGLCQSNAFVNHCNSIICGYYDAINQENNKTYFFKHFDDFKKIGELLAVKSKKLYSKYNFFYHYIQKHKLPISLRELKINGDDLKENFKDIPSKKYNIVLQGLLDKVFDGVIENQREALLKEVENDYSNSDN